MRFLKSTNEAAAMHKRMSQISQLYSGVRNVKTTRALDLFL
jgi:hypothetical protein